MDVGSAVTGWIACARMGDVGCGDGTKYVTVPTDAVTAGARFQFSLKAQRN